MDQGYSIDADVFDRDHMTMVADALAGADLLRTKAGARQVLALPAVRALASDSRMMGLAARYIGPDPVPFRATLFDKSAAANWLVTWHQDTALPLRCRTADPEWGPWSRKAGFLHAHAPAWALGTVVALRVSLDDSTAANGPLRVVPDSHRSGVLTDAEIRDLVARSAPRECVAPCGSVVAMRPLTVHASSKAATAARRRVLHIEYAASLNLGKGLELAVG